MKRTIFIGDIHGCYDEFQLLLDKLKVKDNDMIYLVWDMINKWPKSWKIIKFLYKNQNQFKCVLWNHELKFLDWLELSNERYHNSIFNKLEDKFTKNPEILNFFKGIPLYIEEDNFLLIHWWLNPSKTLEEHTPNEITNIREVNEQPWYEQYTWDKMVVYGHWALNWLSIRDKTIGLDTGCPYGWALTAYILETWEVYSQPALDIYQDIFSKIRKTCI
jgi:bis(5'-nucleosyl)-tetraphosphatase (symmetrical)